MATNVIRFLPPRVFFREKLMEMNPDLIPTFVRDFLTEKDYNTFLWQFRTSPINTLDYLYTIIQATYAGTPKYKKACIDHHLQRLIYPQVLIFVAKDHEATAVEYICAELELNWTQHDRAGGIFGFSVDHLSCCISVLNDMGWTAATNVTNVIKELCPTYVGVLGSCGGVKEDVGKVWFFEAACYKCDTTVEVIYPVARQMKPEALWRIYEDDPKNLVKRDKASIPTVFTTKTKSTAGPDFITECIKMLPNNNITTHGVDKEHVEKLSIHGVEMEVAAIWKVVQDWNAHNPKLQITLLPAVKGVSDSGSDEERQEHMIPVIKAATQFLIQYLKLQLKYLKP